MKVIDFSLTHFTATVDWRLTTLDQKASKLMGIVGEDMFIYKGPFSGEHNGLKHVIDALCLTFYM